MADLVSVMGCALLGLGAAAAPATPSRDTTACGSSPPTAAATMRCRRLIMATTLGAHGAAYLADLAVRLRRAAAGALVVGQHGGPGGQVDGDRAGPVERGHEIAVRDGEALNQELARVEIGIEMRETRP